MIKAVDSIIGGSPDRFGYEWSVYSQMRPEYEEQFRRWTAHLKPEDWKGRTFLDVGCGMGRNSFWPMTYGALGGVAVDVDDRSLHATQTTLAHYPSVIVEERSAYDLGYRDRFDIAFSIGVIDHLDFPERAIAEMARAVKTGGRVLIWVYGLENNRWIVKFHDPLRRAVFSRLPIGFVHHLSLYAAAVVWAVVRLRVRPIEYFRLVRRMQFAHLRSIVFDQMLPRTVHYWPRERVARMMLDAGLEDVALIWVNQMSWSAIGTKGPAKIASA